MNHNFPPLGSLLGGETHTIEYKQDNNQRHQGEVYPDEAIAESLMAMSNAEGGYLLLGVDNKGSVTGLNPRRSERPHVLMNRPANDSLYRLLRRMVADGLLAPEGERATTRYVKH